MAKQAWFGKGPGRRGKNAAEPSPIGPRVFLVTHGRTGSTLLQGILSEVFGIRFYGENGGFLQKAFKTYQALSQAPSKVGKPENDTVTQPWFGATRFQDAAIVPRFRQFIDDILFGIPMAGADAADRSDYAGFKEIRHIFTRIDLGEYLSFVRTIYPECKFIFLTRDIEQVLNSGWWARNDPAKARTEIEDFVANVREYVETDEQSLLLDYDEIANGVNGVDRLAEFLLMQYERCILDDVRAQSFSYAGRNLTALLRGDDSDIRLLDRAWWESEVVEFQYCIPKASEVELLLELGVLMRGESQPHWTLKTAENRYDICWNGCWPSFADRFRNHGDLGGTRATIALSPEELVAPIELLADERHVASLICSDAGK